MDDAVIEIDSKSDTPAYRQVVNQVRALLVAGVFSPGEQLATVRELAAALGVHHNTVAEAYRVLAKEGWLELRRKVGARVVKRAVPKASARSRTRFSSRLREVAAEGVGQGLANREIATELRALAAFFDGKKLSSKKAPK